MLFGILSVYTGGIKAIWNGSKVNIKINEGEETQCRVIEGGFYTGLNKCTIVIEGDETQTKRYVPIEQVKPYISKEFYNLKIET